MEPPFPVTEKAKRMKNYLLILSLIHFTAALILLFYGGSMFSVITPIMLCCAAQSMQYYCLMFYIFYSMIDTLTYFTPCGLALQQTAYGYSVPAAGLIAVFFLMFCFLCFAIWYAFQCYREFKAL